MKRAIRFAAAVLVLAAGCRDNSTDVDPDATNPPDGFALEVQDTLVQGEPFVVTVTALGADGLPDSDWSGPVTLRASVGALSPSTLQVENGSITAQVTLTGGAGAVTLTAASGAVASEPVLATVLSGQPPARIEIIPSSALLTDAGDSQTFEARAYDADGAPTTAQVTWSTNDAATVRVDSAGTATAQAIGSALVTASANGVVSQPAMVLVAQPAGDPVLLTDEQILTDPVAVDPFAEYAPGWQYRVRVRNASMQTNDIVLGTGSRPLAGRVISMTDVGNGESDVTVELLPLTQLFTELSIDESIPLVEMDASEFRPAGLDQGLNLPAAYGARADTFPLGPFRCTYELSHPDLEVDPAKTNIDPKLSLDVRYRDGELSRFVVTGRLIGNASYRPVLKGKFGASTTCETPPRVFTAPFGGPAALVFGLQIPIGVGFTLEGEVEVAEIGFDIQASATATAELGITCTAGGSCSGVREFDTTRDWKFEFVSPDPEEDFRVKLAAHGFVYARPYIGSRYTQRGAFELIDANTGLKQSVDLAPAFTQVSDTAYASSFDLQFLTTIGPGKGMQSALEKIGKLIGVDLSGTIEPRTIADTLAQSPTGTFTISPDRVAPGDSTRVGDLATFKVDLDRVDYMGIPSVEKIEFLWKQETEDDSSFTLEPGRPTCMEIQADDSQRSFECETDFLPEHRGEQTFFAFMDAELFGLPLPVPLEIAVNAQAKVVVSELCAQPPADLVPELLVSADTLAAGDDRLDGLSFSVTRHQYGDLAITASASNTENGGSTARLRTSASWNDWVLVTPEDPARIGEGVYVRFNVSGSLETDADSPNYEGVSASFSYRVGGGNAYQTVSDTTDLRYERPAANGFVRLGSWEALRGTVNTEVEKYRTSRGTSSASASVRLSDMPIEVVDVNGQPVEATVCTASGHVY